MRTPSEVAKQIKAALIQSGIKATAQARNYQVKVQADSSETARNIAKNVYHQEPHGWLIVWVDNHILPMPPVCG